MIQLALSPFFSGFPIIMTMVVETNFLSIGSNGEYILHLIRLTACVYGIRWPKMQQTKTFGNNVSDHVIVTIEQCLSNVSV